MGNDNKVSRLTALEVVFLMALTIYVSVNLFQTTYLYNMLAASNSGVLLVMKLMRYLAYFLCVIKISQKFSGRKKSIVFFLMTVMLALLVAATGTDKSPLFYILFIYAALDVDFYKIIKVFFVLQILTFVFCFFCCYFVGIGSEYVLNDGRNRAYLGFGWVNRAAYMWLFMWLEYICIKKEKVRLIEYVLFEGIAFWIYKKTVTRFALVFSLLVGTIFIFINIYNKWGWHIKANMGFAKLEKILYRISMPCFALLGIGMSFIYSPGNTILNKINQMVNSRLSLGKSAIEQYGLGILGNDTVWTGSSTLIWGLSGSDQYNYVDCGYLQLTLDYGLIFLVFVLFLYDLAIRNSVQLEQNWIRLCIAFIGLVCVFEPRFVDFTVNPFVFYGLCTINTVRKIKQENIEKS